MKSKKPILIQGAMKDEIKDIKEKIENRKEEIVNGYTFYIGEIENYPVIVSKTNIGLIHVTTATMLAISKWNPSIIMNQGVAGGIDKKIHRGDIVIGSSCININSFQTPMKEEGEGSNPFTWELKTFQEGEDCLQIIKPNRDLLELAREIKKKKKNILEGRIGSGDVWNAEKDRLKWLNENYDILCEDMETIAVYKIGETFEIPVLGLRAISDNMMIGEEYDKSVAIEAQKFTYELIQIWIKEEKGKNKCK